MIIKETARSTYLDVSKIAWESTKYPGVEIKVLYRDPSGKLTSLTRMAPGARLPDHRHVGVEQSYVLEGTLVDDDGACTAGNFVHRRPGSVHDAWSPDGCVVLGIFAPPSDSLGGGRPASAAARPGRSVPEAEGADAGRLASGDRVRVGLRLQPGLDEAVVQDLSRVEEGETARMRTQHDHEELLAAAPGRHREVVACLLREARLQRLDAARVVEERDAAGRDPAACKQ